MSGVQVVLQVSSQMFSVNVQQAVTLGPDQLADAVRVVAGELIERVVAAVAASVPVLDANQAPAGGHAHSDTHA